MAKRGRHGSKRLGFSPDRWSVFAVGPTGAKERPCSQSTYTSYGDAAKAALRCSKKSLDGKRWPCLLLSGWAASTPNIVGVCKKGHCREVKESDANLIKKCGVSKKNRRSLIAERVKLRTSRTPTSMGPSKAAKSGRVPA